MLSLPKRLLFGQSSDIDFKLSQTDGIARLYSERHIPYHDSKYWSRFLSLDSPTDIFSLLSLSDLRRARRDASENIVTLVRVMVAHLESLVLDPLFEPPPPSAAGGSGWIGGMADVTKWGLMGESGKGKDGRDRTKEALNVIRILTRTLPAVMESEDEEFEREVLWSQAPGVYEDSAPQTATSRPTDADKLDTSAQFVIDSSDEEEEVTDHPLAQPNPPDTTQDSPIPIALGERLLRLVIDLLFCSGFTLPWTPDQLSEPSAQRINYSIWEAGVGSSLDLPSTTRFHVSNRVEVLRLLLVLLSKSIYIPAHKQSSTVDPALKFAVQDLDRGVVLPLLCSLINTAISNAKNSTSAWLGLGSVSSMVGGSNDEVRTNLVTLSLQILDVLLTYEAPLPGEGDTISLSTVGRPLPGPGGRNVFRFYLSKLHRSSDFSFIWDGLHKSFSEHMSSTIQILAIPIPTGAGSKRAAETTWQLNQVAERLILLWRLLEHNQKFRSFVLEDVKRAPELLGVLLYFGVTYKDNVALQGLVRLCVFILQDVSSHPGFATNLAKAGSAQRVGLPSRLGLVAGNTAIDLLVQAVYSLIATTKGQLSSLYAPLVIALSNTAPSWRAVSITASTKVIHLLRSFSQPSFLLSEEGNPRILFYLLEAINAVLTMGYNQNVNLVYSLVLARGLVESLERFGLRRGVEEVWKRRRQVGTETRDWFEGVARVEKAPLPTAEEEEGEEGEGGKGKQRRLSTSSPSPPLPTQGELAKYPLQTIEEAAALHIGKSGFRPTQAWVDSWHPHLPLRTPRLVIDALLPEVERIAAGGGVPSADGKTEITGGDTDARVLAYLREQKMQDYLPPPEGGIHSRGWVWTNHAEVWLRSYLWGTIYVSGMLPWGVWNDTLVRLIRIHGREGGGSGATSPALERTSMAASSEPGAPPSAAPA